MNSQKTYFYIQFVIIEKYRERIGGVGMENSRIFAMNGKIRKIGWGDLSGE